MLEKVEPLIKREPTPPVQQENLKVQRAPTPQMVVQRQEVIAERESPVKAFDDQKLQVQLQELQRTFKGDLEGLRTAIKTQDSSLKEEVGKLFVYQQQTE